MTARELLLCVLKVLDRNAYEAACISDWDMTVLIDAIDDRMAAAATSTMVTRDCVAFGIEGRKGAP